MRRLDLGKTVTLSAMTVALVVLMLYAASLFPVLALPCCLFSLFIMYALIHEKLYVWTFAAYMLSLILSWMLTNGGLPLAAYALLGHYGLFKDFADARIRDVVIRTLLKLAYCNAWIAIALLLCITVFSLDISTGLPALPLWFLILLLEIALFLFDILFSLWQRFYETRLRNAILPRK